MQIWMVNAEELAREGAPEIPRAEFFRELIEAATSRAAGPAWRSAVRCTERAGRRPCRGRMTVSRNEPQALSCSCEDCFQVGVISGFEGTAMDLSRYLPRERTVCWGFDDESRKVLREATVELPSLRAVVARASPHIDVPRLLVMPATMAELDGMYSLVEDLLGRTRGERRRELFEDLLASLCTAIDGF